MYYSTLLAWLVGVGRPAYAKRGLHYAAFLLVALGLGGSAYFVWIMSRVISEWCPWCVFTHVLNLLIFICMVFMWPKRRALGGEKTAPEGSAAGDAAERTGGVVHPSARVLMLTLISMALVNYAHTNMLGLKTWRRTAEQAATNYQNCMSVLERFRGDTGKLFGQWQRGREYEIKITDKDRIRTYPVSASMVQPPPMPLTVVIYSDFECPGCGKFAQFFEKQVPKMLGGNVRAVYRHFPLNPACNPLAQTNVHPHACEAVKLVEGVRLLAGNEGFWKAHDFVFRNQESLRRGTLTPDEVAKAVGIGMRGLSSDLHCPSAHPSRSDLSLLLGVCAHPCPGRYPLFSASYQNVHYEMAEKARAVCSADSHRAGGTVGRQVIEWKASLMFLAPVTTVEGPNVAKPQISAK